MYIWKRKQLCILNFSLTHTLSLAFCLFLSRTHTHTHIHAHSIRGHCQLKLQHGPRRDTSYLPQEYNYNWRDTDVETPQHPRQSDMRWHRWTGALNSWVLLVCVRKPHKNLALLGKSPTKIGSSRAEASKPWAPTHRCHPMSHRRTCARSTYVHMFAHAVCMRTLRICSACAYVLRAHISIVRATQWRVSSW